MMQSFHMIQWMHEWWWFSWIWNWLNTMLMENWQFYAHGSWLWLCQRKRMIKLHCCMISLEVKYQGKIRSEFFIIMLFTYNIICFLCVLIVLCYFTEYHFPYKNSYLCVCCVEIDSCWQNFAKTDMAFKMAAEFWQNEMFRCSKACLRGSRIAVKLLFRMWLFYLKTSQVTFPVVYKQMWFLMVICGFLWVSSATLIQQHLLLQWQLTAAPLNQLFLFCLNTNPFLGETQICRKKFFQIIILV